MAATDDAFKQTEAEVKDQINRLTSIGGNRSSQSFHRELGKIMWEYCGISRSETSLKKGLELIPELRDEFWKNLKLPGDANAVNQSLEHAGRVADFFDFAELKCTDALQRDESCGCHFREEHQTEESEAKRDDENFANVSVWEYTGENSAPQLNLEPLEFKALPLATRNYNCLLYTSDAADE